jgi:hypothetical protein
MKREKRELNSQRRPDSTRNNDVLDNTIRATDLTAKIICDNLVEADILRRSLTGEYSVIPGEEDAAWIEIGLEPDEFMTPNLRHELKIVENIGVKVIVTTAEKAAIDWHDPFAGSGSLTMN